MVHTVSTINSQGFALIRYRVRVSGRMGIEMDSGIKFHYFGKIEMTNTHQ